MKIFKKIASTVLSLSVIFPATTMFKSDCVEAHFSQADFDNFCAQAEVIFDHENASEMLIFSRDIYNKISVEQNEPHNNADDKERLKKLTMLGIRALYSTYMMYLFIGLPDISNGDTLQNVLSERAHNIFDGVGYQLFSQPVEDLGSLDVGQYDILSHCTFSHEGTSVAGLFHQYKDLQNYDEAAGSLFNAANDFIHGLTVNTTQTAHQTE